MHLINQAGGEPRFQIVAQRETCRRGVTTDQQGAVARAQTVMQIKEINLCRGVELMHVVNHHQCVIGGGGRDIEVKNRAPEALRLIRSGLGAAGASLEEVVKKDFSLVPSKYIEFVNRDENIDFDEKMQSLQTEFVDLLKAESQSKNDLLTVFKELGYEINL